MKSLPFFTGRCTALLVASTLAACSTTNLTNTDNRAATELVGPSVTIYAAGDIAECRSLAPKDTMAARTADVIAAALATDTTAVALTLGDNAYRDGTTADYANCYEPTWGRFKQRTLPSPGNHEYHTPSAAGYFDYFGALAGPERRGYYSKTIGSWHVISLNSNLKGSDQQAQLDWLKADLATHRSGCALAFWHHPVFSSGDHGNNANMRDAWRLLAAAGTDLVLSGHDHDYERFAPQDVDGNLDVQRGIRQFVVGNGGARLTPIVTRRAHSEAANDTNFGVIKLQLAKTGYAWEFLPAAGGNYRDGGSADCHR